MDIRKPKVCVITAARSEYGLLHWIIDSLSKDDSIQFQLIATGSHMAEEFGMTYHFIEEDGYAINSKIDMQLHTKDIYTIPRSMGICAEKIGEAFHSLRPDIIIVLGDRYELLPIVSTALVLNIPVAHISGGDVTEGAIDNEVRNAVSCMSTLHFPGIENSAKSLERILGTNKNIFVCGEPGLDSFSKIKPIDKITLAKELALDTSKKWALVTIHSETKESLDYNIKMGTELYEVMKLHQEFQYIVTKANADFGGSQINSFWESVQSDQIKVFTSLGQKRYLSIMHYVDCVIGNSSSGVVEAPFLGIPVINIGNRQKGRHICKNVCCCEANQQDINSVLLKIDEYRYIDTFWGDGKTSERIVSHIKDYLNGE